MKKTSVPITENAPVLPSYADLKTQNSALISEIEILRHNLGILQRAMFGTKSEKSDPLTMEQLSLLFDEAEAGCDPQAEMDLDDGEDDIIAPETKKKTGRKPLPANLPRKKIIYDLPESEKRCPCGCMLTKIGEETSEQLDYIPATLQVIQNIRYKYACKSCEDTVRRAPVPVTALPRSNATAGLLSQIIVSKFEDHLPLDRQSKIWARLDIAISTTTLCNWTNACGTLLAPLVTLLQQDIVAADYVCSDETTVNVLDSTTSTQYMWVHMSGDRAKRAVVFEYQPSRAGKHATSFLKGFQGAHQCDAYAGYHALHLEKGIFCVACWAHARRKFVDITKLVKTPGLAHQMVMLIRKLYKVESEADDQGLDPDARRILRQTKSVPILASIKKLLDDYKGKVLPKSPLGQAITYAINQWDDLNSYVTDGRLRIDNNDCERAIRPFAIGRKNWMFSKTTHGATASATLYSLIATCKANGINPFRYLRYVLLAIKTATTKSELRALLPYNISKALISQ
jgi:transposase